MHQPGPEKNYQQQSKSTGFFIYLSNNMLQVGVLLVLVVGGIIAYLALNQGQNQKTRESTEKPEWTLKDIREGRSRSRYADADCGKDLHCRQLKRIYADGGASPEAVRKNLLAADRGITFEQLRENPNRYEGRAWAFEGTIVDIVWQDNSVGSYTRAGLMIEDGPGKRVSVRGDFETGFSEGDYVYVVGYITGTAYPPLGPSSEKNKGFTPALTARALLKPGEARDILYGAGTN